MGKKKYLSPPAKGATILLVKYALSSGVTEHKVVSILESGSIKIARENGADAAIVSRKDIVLDTVERNEKVLDMIERKLASLEKQRAKLCRLRDIYT